MHWFAQTFSTRQEAMVALSAIFQQERRPAMPQPTNLTRALPLCTNGPTLFVPSTSGDEPSRGPERLLVLDGQGKKTAKSTRAYLPLSKSVGMSLPAIASLKRSLQKMTNTSVPWSRRCPPREPLAATRTDGFGWP